MIIKITKWITSLDAILKFSGFHTGPRKRKKGSELLNLCWKWLSWVDTAIRCTERLVSIYVYALSHQLLCKFSRTHAHLRKYPCIVKKKRGSLCKAVSRKSTCNWMCDNITFPITAGKSRGNFNTSQSACSSSQNSLINKPRGVTLLIGYAWLLRALWLAEVHFNPLIHTWGWLCAWLINSP